MAFDPQAIFANLAEKERIKGHHSAEGRAIRIFSRALTGWSSGNLSVSAVLVLCEQGMEDWLKSRLDVPAWSARSLPQLLEKAVDRKLLERSDAIRLQKMQLLRARLNDSDGDANVHDVETALELCIRLVEKHW